MTTYEEEREARKAARARIHSLDVDQLRDVAFWLVGYNPDLLNTILNDLEEDWSE